MVPDIIKKSELKKPDFFLQVDPCGIFSDDLEGKSCNVIWSSADGGLGWTVNKISALECSITGTISEVQQ